ncbi:hypothetical protein [Pseudomonas kurunegalensis]|uniref:hypothetical protein n=1 Tax=Pseudomonas kurunegalensis TaxID=485880 RepID=UPI003D803C26
MKPEEFRKAMDDDENFKKKRANLFYLSLLLIAIIISGAEIKEANTLIFKIEFTDYENLQWLLIAGILYSVLRYYAYSEKYRNELFKQWSGKMFRDYRIYTYDVEEEVVGGLLEKAVDVWGGDEPGLVDAEYRKTGILRRSIAYPTREMHERGEAYFHRHISLNTFTDKWKFKHLMTLFRYEIKYRVNAWVSHRETLDLVAPYLLAACALAIFFYEKLV